MRRLVDETTDELTRSLLSAGIEHQPPPGNKARVLMAIGAGGALGLFSSNALAWLSTTTGKVTALGVAVGVAGAVWVAVPPAGEARSGRDAAAAKASAGKVVDEAAGVEAAMADAAAGRVGGVSSNAARTGAALGERGALRVEGSVAAGAADASDARESTAVSLPVSPASDAVSAKEPRKASGGRRERGARKHAARKTSAQREAAESAEFEVPSGEGAIVGAVDLDSEVRLVDDMHSAARRNDRAALGRFLDRYRETFPDGQLKKEVAEFAARLDHPDISKPR